MTMARESFLGEFRLLELLGFGGGGEVWRAVHPRHGLVALKLLCPVGPPVRILELRARLEREADLATAARHENVLQVVEHGSRDGRSYLATELLEGNDLEHVLIHRGALDPPATFAIIDQVLAALEAVHAAGIVHRDLKPANIFLHVPPSGPPRVKLIDFGIAHAEDGRELTQSGAIVGTPHYLSPEQAIGADVDARSDIWSVGILLYELLSGRTPFDDMKVSEILLALAEAREIVPLAELRPDLPSYLTALIHRAIDDDPDRRPATATEFRAELSLVAVAMGVRTGPEWLDGLVAEMRELSDLDVEVDVDDPYGGRSDEASTARIDPPRQHSPYGTQSHLPSETRPRPPRLRPPRLRLHEPVRDVPPLRPRVAAFAALSLPPPSTLTLPRAPRRTRGLGTVVALSLVLAASAAMLLGGAPIVVADPGAPPAHPAAGDALR